MALVKNSVFRKERENKIEISLSTEELLLQHRTAFIKFLDNEKSLETVKRYYPESVQFVISNADRSLKEVTTILQEMIRNQKVIL
jgi:hypothetical protein